MPRLNSASRQRERNNGTLLTCAIAPSRGNVAVRCARGEMENRIKEQQLGLFADRTSAHQWWTNQFRLLLSSLAYVLMETIRRLALHDTELAHAQVGTSLLKIGAIILRNTRRIRFLLSSAFPYQNLFYAAAKQLVPGQHSSRAIPEPAAWPQCKTSAGKRLASRKRIRRILRTSLLSRACGSRWREHLYESIHCLISGVQLYIRVSVFLLIGKSPKPTPAAHPLANCTYYPKPRTLI